MNALRGLWVLQLIGITVLTIFAIRAEGWDLLSIFFGDIKAMNWSGQFNFDFSCYLVLSGLWIAWRHRFSIGSILLGVAASILGILLFAPYLIWASYQAKGDVKVLLLGEN
ncbi:MAG: hypothetical protein AAF927_34485 [Bacteroidota bacterium]